MHSELHQRHQLWTSLKTECFNFWPYYLDLWPLMSPSMSVHDAGHHTVSIKPGLVLVRLPVPKIWLIFGHGVKWPGDLDLWPFDLLVGSRVTRIIGFLPANFQLRTPFILDLGSGMGQTDRQRPSDHLPHPVVPAVWHRKIWTQSLWYAFL